MSEIVNIDLLGVQRGVIVHQVNCRGAMGRGLALSIRKKWPVVYSEYRKLFSSGKLILGEIQIVQVGPELYVCNLAGQDRWSTDSPNTDLGAYSLAWPIVSHEAENLGLPVYAPWMFGCGLAGGDWSVVRPIIEALCPEVIWARRDTGHTWERYENYRGF